MSHPKRLSKRIIYKFKVAYNGLIFGLLNDISIQIQTGFALIALSLAFIFKFNEVQWAIWILCISLVLAFEYINSALETVLDLVDSQPNPLVKTAKDFASASVLISALGSLIIGIIFILNQLR